VKRTVCAECSADCVAFEGTVALCSAQCVEARRARDGNCLRCAKPCAHPLHWECAVALVDDHNAKRRART